MSNKWQVKNIVEEASDIEEIEEEENNEESSEDDELSGLDIPETKLPVLRAIVNKGKAVSNNQQQFFQHNEKNEDADKLAIREELSALTFEELQKLKEKIGSKKFNQTLTGVKKKAQMKTDFKRANPNRPREISSKSRKIETKVAVQVPKVFRSDPRFDNLCGEFRERSFYRNYDFVNKMKEDEVKKLKEELREETLPKRIEKIKYLIQRMENQIRAVKKRKLEEEKQEEEKRITIEALKEGKSPYFATKWARKERDLKEKFETLKEEGRLNQYMAKKRKHNAQRDRRHMPSDYY
uniref:rRNA biogenesis protein RRP36 n=1 Tax=Daphnia lumholtzi TaxID=42856 RepID=A0A4Y7MEV8_9CRUS|nr:EOG090X0E8U [Daphnia lumholtzi]SVE77883.1 EOG090X0E8U [Daphnia lumholtzi]SVE78513.1 EOG090X0E8U [Daphnia lumholtzi]SVE79142.1 EOG090X0E8U [Daphnia lumholtzi]